MNRMILATMCFVGGGLVTGIGVATHAETPAQGDKEPTGGLRPLDGMPGWPDSPDRPNRGEDQRPPNPSQWRGIPPQPEPILFPETQRLPWQTPNSVSRGIAAAPGAFQVIECEEPNVTLLLDTRTGESWWLEEQSLGSSYVWKRIERETSKARASRTRKAPRADEEVE